MREINVFLSNGNKINAVLLNEELIFGATAILISKDENLFGGKIGKIHDIFAINPATNEKMDIIVDNLNKGAIFLTPAHIREHYALALKYDLKFKQVVAPYFRGEGNHTIREDQPVQTRYSVIAIVKHNKEDKYLCVDSKGRLCKSFVLGGMENGETHEEAALREIEEETGYYNIKLNHTSLFELHNHFYADYKGVNRYAHLRIVFCDLIDELRNEMSEKEATEHDVLWIKKEELMNFLSVPNNKFACKILIEGENAYEGDGKMINSDYLDGMNREEAKIYIEKNKKF